MAQFTENHQEFKHSDGNKRYSVVFTCNIITANDSLFHLPNTHDPLPHPVMLVLESSYKAVGIRNLTLKPNIPLICASGEVFIITRGTVSESSCKAIRIRNLILKPNILIPVPNHERLICSYSDLLLPLFRLLHLI